MTDHKQETGHEHGPGNAGESLLEMRARLYATDKHAEQKRKYTFEPYITHPRNVAETVRGVPHSEEMLAAAWLHDVVEDCLTVRHVDIWNLFGSEVCFLVMQLTDISCSWQGSRKERKAIDRIHTSHACADAKTIKLADLIDNSSSIMEHDPKFAKVYLAEKRLLLDEALREGDATLWARADEICKKAGL